MMERTPARLPLLLALALLMGCPGGRPGQGEHTATPTAPVGLSSAAPAPPPDAEYAPAGFSVRQVAPEGLVTRELLGDSKDVPSGWRPASQPRLVVAPPVIESGAVVLRVTLVNDTDEPVTTYLVSAPHTQGPLLPQMGGPGTSLRPAREARTPEIYPAPEKVTLGPHARLPFERALLLSRYEHRARAPVTVAWTFEYWSSPAKGRFDLVLP